MKIFIDSSVFLKLFLDEPGADKAQEILEGVEKGLVTGIVTPLVLEEVSFKLLFAKTSELIGTANPWRIREALIDDDAIRRKAMATLSAFRGYIDYLYSGGLRMEPLLYSDWLSALNFVDKYGLLPADAVHVAVALRSNVDAIASFDNDFKRLRELRTIP